MADPGGSSGAGDRNPYAVGDRPGDGPAGAPPSGPPPGPRAGPPGRPSPGPVPPALRRRARGTALLASVAAVAAVVLPPVGVALGVAVLLAGARLRRDPAARSLGGAATWVPVAAGAFAVLVGGALSVMALYLRTELTDLRECQAGANTRIAQANCQDAFREAVEERLGLR